MQLQVTEQQIVAALRTVIDEFDADDLAQLAGTVLGGDCEFLDDAEARYGFTPNAQYSGAFDDEIAAQEDEFDEHYGVYLAQQYEIASDA